MFHKSRGRLDTAFKEVIGARGTVRHLIPRIEVEIADLEPTIEAEDVEDAVKSLFDEEPRLELRVSLSKTPYRGNLKAYVLLEEARALKLLKEAHIKIGWVCCRDRRKKEMNQCFRCLGFDHIAVNCRGPDRSRCCWRCGEEGQLACSSTRKPRCFLCAAMEEKPRNDHIPRTPRPRDREGVLVGRAARAAETHTPGRHGISLTVHKAFLPSSKKKKKKMSSF